MTRSAEKLAGDWERRIDEAAKPIRWRSVAWNGVLLLLAIIIGFSALFGFAY